MGSNDYWTHVGLVVLFFTAVVGPRLFSPGHTANSMAYIAGGTMVILVATIARVLTKRADSGKGVADHD
jgi:hypothetical protein